MKSPRKSSRNPKEAISRRSFIGGAVSTAAAFTIVPRHVLGGQGNVAPSDKVTTACIGVGAQGTRVMMKFLKQPDMQIVSVCDVNRESKDYSEWGTGEIRRKVKDLVGTRFRDRGESEEGATCGREPARELVNAYYAGQSSSDSYNGCTAYNDFRELLEKEKDLDAVIVGTADHWHVPISVAAMKKGKHVYCQKPLTHSIYEARRMAEVARETGVATQLATGNSASEATRLLSEWIWDRAIGPVRHVINWSTRPFWPQGLERPEETQPVPPGLDWDLWLGPAPDRPFNHVYLPFVWRGWYDFGNGALGDMGCYSFHTIFRVMKLDAPIRVEASSTPKFEETFPVGSIIHFDFAARSNMPPVRITWYDGELKPPRPPELDEEDAMARGNEGLMFVGDRGKILCGFNGRRPRLIPTSRMDSYDQPPQTLPRSIGHDREWIEACKGGAAPGANFEFAGNVTEGLLLGNVAVRAGETLEWDSSNMKVTNGAAANQYIRREYRGNWKL